MPHTTDPTMPNSAGELRQLRADMAQELSHPAEFRAAMRSVALDAIREAMQFYGIEPHELRRHVAYGRRVPVKYPDPATGREWSGRGRTPLWLRGVDREAFRVEVQA